MYKVRYYMGSHVVFKFFKTLTEAVEFSNKRVRREDTIEIVKVD